MRENILPGLVPPLSEHALRAAEAAASMVHYEPHGIDELGMMPQLIAVKPSGQMIVSAFVDNAALKMAGPARRTFLMMGCCTAFVSEAWVGHDSKELIEGSGVVMPPRVDPNRTEEIMVQVMTPAPERRLVVFCNSVVGSGDQKHLDGWRVLSDSARGDKGEMVQLEPDRVVVGGQERGRP